MHLTRLLKTGDPEAIRRLLFVTGLAGLANVMLLGLINSVAESAATSQPIGLRMLAFYLMAAAIYLLADRASLRGANDLVQKRLGELRQRLADKIRHSELRALERIGRGEIYSTVVQETNYLSQNFPLLVSAGQGAFLVLFSLVYIAFLSQISFVVISLFVLAGVLLYKNRRRRLNSEMMAVHASESAMVESLTHFADGFQEIRLNADKNDALYRHFVRIVDGLESVVVGISRKWVALVLFGSAFCYALLGAAVLILPVFFAGHTDIIYKIATALIFCVGPVSLVTSAAHMYVRADIGLGHVYSLETRLDEKTSRDVSTGDSALAELSGFQAILFEEIAFRYEDSLGRITFEVGPWNFELKRGETVFLRGGNGSGKSTFLKLICGLYRPFSGRITVDGAIVNDRTLQQFRELFSSIFTDFHLFDRLHGLEEVEPAAVQALIDRMELTHKVQFVDGRFSTLDLSTGQRKRLAMIVSLLEDREVYLFDEWAADQDSHFREVFYLELLPELKRRGKTIVVVTHDDRYWHIGDRLITLDLGAIVSAQSQA